MADLDATRMAFVIELGDPALAEVINILRASDDEIRRADLLARMDKQFRRYKGAHGWFVDIDAEDREERIEELLDLLSECYEELRRD